MFGKLKDMATAGAVEKAVAGVEPIVREHFSKVLALGATSVRDDANYAAQIVRPAYLAVVAAASGATKLVPQFEDRFNRVMHALRDELLIVDGDSVRLVDDYQARLPTLLVSSLKG
jgi:hypothetical protein